MNFDCVLNRNIIKDNEVVRNYDIVLFVRTNCTLSQKLYQECLSQSILGSLKIINIDIPLGRKFAKDILGQEPLTTPVTHSMFNKKTVYGYKPLVNIMNELISPMYCSI
jgi:hypothetical protein